MSTCQCSFCKKPCLDDFAFWTASLFMPANQTWRGCHSPKCPWYLCVFPMTGSPVQFMTNATEQTEQTASEICSPVGGRNQSLPIFALYYNLLGVMRVWEIWAIWQSLGCRGIDGRGSTLKNIPCHLQLFNPCRHSAIHSISLHSPHSAALFPSQAPCFHAPVFLHGKAAYAISKACSKTCPQPCNSHTRRASKMSSCTTGAPLVYRMCLAHCSP